MATATTSGPQQQVNMPAVDLRRFLGVGVLSEGAKSATDLLVAQRGAGANMSVDVSAGSCYVADDHGSGGGYYHGVWSATENVLVSAAHPTLPRVDRVVVQVLDQFLGDASNAIAITVIPGTATAGATLANLTGAPAVPGSSLLLANVLVPAASVSVTTANIDTSVKATLGLAGASLTKLFDSTLGSAQASIDTGAILPASCAQLHIVLAGRGDTALGSTAILLRFNNDSGANYNYQIIAANNTALVANAGAATGFVSPGSVPAASAPASVFGSTEIWVPNYAGTTGYKSYNSISYFETADTAAGQNLNQSGGIWKSTAAITRVALLLAAGNFAAGSRMTVYGLT